MKQKLLILLLLTIPILRTNAQTTGIDHWEMIISSDDQFKYWTSNNGDPGEQWRDPEYDDASWPTGPGGIGYGDDDDLTMIDQCNAVLIRKQFTVSNKADIIEAQLQMSYDDAFVAYLNGVEIARSSGLSDAFPAYDALSTTQHEIGSNGNYSIQPEILDQLLVNGNNLLAIQVHNASTTSSDLSSNTWLFAAMATGESQFRDTPDWFIGPVTFTSSNLPIIVIETENNAVIVDDPKITAYMGIIYNAEGEINHLTDEHNHYSGYIGIELRGNSTQNFPKKPYALETRNAAGANLNVSLFGWPAENDWILRASYLDHTFIRNGLANHMSRQNGYWASHTQLVEVILNGEYQGIYIFMEKIKRDAGRVDIANLLLTDITEPEITGGYIWEITGFDTNFGSSRKLKYPDYDEAAAEQITYITSVDDHFRSVMMTEDFDDSTTGYHSLIDVGTFVNEIMVQEAMRNSDAYGWSGYFHKDKLGKICAGPVWDFDQSAGNSSYPDNGVLTGWMFEHPSTSNTPFFWPVLFSDTVFAYEVRHRWDSLREKDYSDESLLGYIDSVALLLNDAQAREFNKWPVLAQNVWRETSGYQQRDSYQKEVDYMKNFLTQRWEWMDNELSQYENPYPPDTTTVTDTTVVDTTTTDTTWIFDNQLAINDCYTYPNPAREDLTFRMSFRENCEFRIYLYNSQGVLSKAYGAYSGYAEQNDFRIDISNLPSGIYHYRIVSEYGQIMTGSVVKLE